MSTLKLQAYLMAPPTANVIAVNDLERTYALRAHRIIADRDHLRETHKAGGSPAAEELDGEWLRWPGHLGSDVVPGECVLAIANVHRGFSSGGLEKHPDVIARAVAATTRLASVGQGRATERQLASYLDGIRPMYELGLSRYWKVGRDFSQGLKAAGIRRNRAELRRVAYVNASCCQVPEDVKLDNPQKVKRELQALCLASHGLGELVQLLRPKVILCSAKLAYEHLVEADLDRQQPTVCFHQRMGDHRLLAPVELAGSLLPMKAKESVWTARLAAHLDPASVRSSPS